MPEGHVVRAPESRVGRHGQEQVAAGWQGQGRAAEEPAVVVHVLEDVGEHRRAPVGEVNVARRMQKEGAVVGGEGNGGVILAALHHTRDAPLAVALVLQHLADEGVALSEAARRWPSYRIVKEKVAFPREALRAGCVALEGDLGG